MLVAHRGFRSKNGENRMCDFQKALQICKAVEFDIRLTKDKKIIIFHDHHFRRIGKKNVTVRKINYDDIKKIDFFEKNPDYLPPLFIDDFTMKLASQYEMINVEVKPSRYSASEFKMLEEALEILRQKTRAEIIVSSFSPLVLQWISQLSSEKFKKGYLFQNPHEINWELITKFDYVHPYVGTVKQRRNLALFKKINRPMNIWTFKKDEDVVKVRELYEEKIIHGYISDKSDLKI